MNKLFGDEIPMGFGMALMQSPQAYTKFFELPQQRRDELVSGTHSIHSKEEMRNYVNHITAAD